MPIRISKNRVDLDNKKLLRPVLQDYGEQVVTADSSTAYTIDLETGNVFDITLTGNCSFTFSNPPASGTAGSFTLILTQDATGSRTVTWPADVKWPADTTPTLLTASTSVDIFTFLTINGGAAWFGAHGQGVGPSEVYLDYAYFGGGYAPGNRSIVDRLDYSNDTATAVAKGPLSLARQRLAATGNSAYGYFGGGYTALATRHSTIDRLDYSSDTTATVAKGPLSTVRDYVSATGTSSYGYFGGGSGPGSPIQKSIVDRVDYSDDTATAVSKGPLSANLYAKAATGDTNYGYFGGGGFPTVSTTDRLDYSSDTTAAVAKGPLSSARYHLAATGNSSYGYFGGGTAPGNVSTIDRLDYSNDTAAAVAKGPLSAALSSLAAGGNASYAYFGGGVTVSTINRLDYSNDTATAVTKGPLSVARSALSGLQNCPL